MKRLYLAPLIVLGLAASLSTIVILVMALSRPWMGITLAPAAAEVVVTGVADRRTDGPLPGDRVAGLSLDGTTLPIRPVDLIEEPDGVATTADMFDVYRASGALADMLETGRAELLLDRDGQALSVPATIMDHRPILDLPAVFWVQMFVGLSCMLVGGWLMAVRPKEPASRWLTISALGLMVSSHNAALYSTRELALPGDMFAWASSFNSLGSLMFGLGMVCLFLTYPVRYLPRWVVPLTAAVIGAVMAYSFLRLGPTPTHMVHLPILTEMIAIVIAAAGQVWATRGNPSARAAMRWFGVSVVTGAGSFVALIAVPQAMGYAPQISQGYAFALFLIVYAGLATGVARYRLFELEFWAFRALFYAGGVAILILLDALLVYAVAVDRIPAFSIALLVVAFLYLPARDFLSRKLTGRRIVTTAELFDLVSQAAMAPGAAAQGEALRRLLDELFHPLSIEDAPAPVTAPALRQGGEAMDVPGIEGARDLRMHWAHRGRRLFSPHDLGTVRAALQMTAQVVERRRAFEAGAEEERQRINRDMHDHIGAQLLGALHSGSETRKNALIRQTLTDLREIVSNPGGDPIALQSLLGDLRAELSEHLGSADIALDWSAGTLPDVQVTPMVVSSVRAILREGVSNILRHAGARNAWITVEADKEGGQDWLGLTIRDDGRGLNPDARPEAHSGNGLPNLAARLRARGGTFAIGPGPEGTGARLTARLPLQVATDRVVSLRDAGE